MEFAIHISLYSLSPHILVFPESTYPCIPWIHISLYSLNPPILVLSIFLLHLSLYCLCSPFTYPCDLSASHRSILIFFMFLLHLSLYSIMFHVYVVKIGGDDGCCGWWWWVVVRKHPNRGRGVNKPIWARVSIYIDNVVVGGQQNKMWG